MPATLQDIASRIGVSRMTVSEVLRDRGSYKPETVAAIRQAAAELGYRPNAQARAMKAKRTGLIGIVLPNSPLPHKQMSQMSAMETVLGLNQTLDDAGYVSTLVPVTDLPGADRSPSRVFTERMLDAMVIIGRIPPEAGVAFDELTEPRIWCDSDVWQPTGCIRRDESAAAVSIGQHLHEVGYRKWVWLDTQSSHYSWQARRDSIEQVANQVGVDLKTVTTPPVHYGDVPNWLTDLSLSPDVAVIAAGGYTATSIAGQAAMLGYTIGRDFGLATCEGVYAIQRTIPQITQVPFFRYSMGEAAARMLCDLLAQPNHAPESKLQKHNLVVGTTTPGPNSN